MRSLGSKLQGMLFLLKTILLASIVRRLKVKGRRGGDSSIKVITLNVRSGVIDKIRLNTEFWS